jgi:hypothetical protein
MEGGECQIRTGETQAGCNVLAECGETQAGCNVLAECGETQAGCNVLAECEWGISVS